MPLPLNKILCRKDMDKIDIRMIETDQETLEKEKYHMAAVKAWETMRRQKIEKIKAEYESVDDYLFDTDTRKVVFGKNKMNPPLIKPSKFTWVEKGDAGKELSAESLKNKLLCNIESDFSQCSG